MKRLNNRILMVMMMIVFVISTIEITENVSKAANYNFNLTGNSKANKGDVLTFTVTANGLTGNVKLTGNNVSLSNNQVWVEKNTVTFTATVNGFPASVTATPVELTDNDYNIVSIGAITRNITEIEATKPGPPVTTTNPTVNSGGQSNNQGQTQGENTGTQSNPVPQTNQGGSQVNQGSTTGSKANQSSTSTNQGNRNYQANSSSNSETNPIFTDQGQVKSSNNYLKNLQVSVGTLSPEFYRETYEYKIDNIIENEIEITAEAEDEKAIINGTGTIALSGGENVINVEVIAENEQARTYTIIVNKVEEKKESNLRLESLEIETINEENKFEDLDIGFNKDTLDYRVTVDDNITDLSVLATVDREGIIIQTEGEKNLKEGENIVTITLISQNNNEGSQNAIDNNLNTEENGIENNGNIDENNQNVNENTENINENSQNSTDNSINNDLQSTNVKEETVYTIKVTRKAKPIVEISNDVYNMKIKKIIAGIVLAILIIALVVTIVINIKKKGNRKKEKLKRKVK